MGHNNREDNQIILFDLNCRLLAAFSTPDSWWEGPLCKITQFNVELLSSALLCVCPQFWFPAWKTGYHFSTAWKKNCLWTNICFHFSCLHPSFRSTHRHVSLGTEGANLHCKMVCALGSLHIRHIQKRAVCPNKHTCRAHQIMDNTCVHGCTWSAAQLNIWPEGTVKCYMNLLFKSWSESK